MSITIKALCKSFGERQVLSNFSATLPDGVTSVLLGRSGSGKTTLLRILAGLETPDSGSITGLEGKTVSVVFQEDRLVADTSALGNLQLVTALSRGALAAELAAFGIDAAAARAPVRTLSGGQARRVALLRGLLYPGELLLLDEPFKGLDDETRRLAQRQYEKLRRGRTALLVTHEAADVAALSGNLIELAANGSNA